MRSSLYESAVDVIATEGLVKATTRAIATRAGLNEVYIYRLYKDKEDLFKHMFGMLDDEFFSAVCESLNTLRSRDDSMDDHYYRVFSLCWRFVLGNKNKCQAYVRYYYSPFFAKYSLEEHRRRYEPIVEMFDLMFREESNTWMLLKHMFNVLFDFAIKVYNGEVPDNEDTQRHVFILIYSSIKPYFRSN